MESDWSFRTGGLEGWELLIGEMGPLCPTTPILRPDHFQQGHEPQSPHLCHVTASALPPGESSGLERSLGFWLPPRSNGLSCLGLEARGLQGQRGRG